MEEKFLTFDTCFFPELHGGLPVYNVVVKLDHVWNTKKFELYTFEIYGLEQYIFAQLPKTDYSLTFKFGTVERTSTFSLGKFRFTGLSSLVFELNRILADTAWPANEIVLADVVDNKLAFVASHDNDNAALAGFTDMEFTVKGEAAFLTALGFRPGLTEVSSSSFSDQYKIRKASPALVTLGVFDGNKGIHLIASGAPRKIGYLYMRVNNFYPLTAYAKNSSHQAFQCPTNVFCKLQLDEGYKEVAGQISFEGPEKISHLDVSLFYPNGQPVDLACFHFSPVFKATVCQE